MTIQHIITVTSNVEIKCMIAGGKMHMCNGQVQPQFHDLYSNCTV